MISLITWQHLNVYSYKLKNNVCVISIFHLYEAKKTKLKLAGKKLQWLVVKKVNFRPCAYGFMISAMQKTQAEFRNLVIKTKFTVYHRMSRNLSKFGRINQK